MIAHTERNENALSKFPWLPVAPLTNMVLSAWLIIYFTERLPISLRKTGKRLHAICKPGLWPREVQSLPAPTCII